MSDFSFPTKFICANRQFLVNTAVIEFTKLILQTKLNKKLNEQMKEEIKVRKDKAHDFRAWFEMS